MSRIVVLSHKPRLIVSSGEWSCYGLKKTWIGVRFVMAFGFSPKDAYVAWSCA